MEDESGNEKRFNDTKDNEIVLGADMKLEAKFRQKKKIPNNNISIQEDFHHILIYRYFHQCLEFLSVTSQ